MFVLLIFLHLNNGIVQVRHSVTNSLDACEKALPLYKNLYEKGKFYDGPPVDDIKYITGRCESIKTKKKGL